MAIFWQGVSECSICGRKLEMDDERFSTWGTFGTPLDLFIYCDSSMHWSCYANWPRREEFARAYFDSWVENEKTDRYWAKAYLDDRVLMTVNPSRRQDGEAMLVLARTGSRVRGDLSGWESWLVDPGTADADGERFHPLVRAELLDVLPALRSALPTLGAVMDAIDGASKGWSGETEGGA